MESEDYSKILRRVRDNRNLQRNIDALRFDDVERLHNQRLEADLRRLPLNEFDASDIPEDLPRRSIVDILA